MSVESVALAAAALMLVVAIARAGQAGLMVAVLTYAAVVAWIIQQDMDMLMAALGIAIVLGCLGLGVVVWREIVSQDDTSRRFLPRLGANNKQATENIGS